MTATPKGQIDWSELTEVDAETLEEVVYTIDGESTDRIDINIKCIQPGPNGWKFGKFGDELSKLFINYVLPPKIRKEMDPREWQSKAEEFANPNKNFESGGVVSEFLLYLFIEAYLDAPIAAHRLYWHVGKNQEVKGSDGLFVGRHEGVPCLYVGEAKFPNSIANALLEAFKSIREFHTTSTNRKLRHEVEIAGHHLQPERGPISTEELEEMSARLNPNTYSDYKIVHPIFVGHQTAKLSWYPNPDSEVDHSNDASEIETQIEKALNESLEKIDYLAKHRDKEPKLSSAVATAELVIFPFPVPDTREFKKQLFTHMFESWK